ncbi:thiamine phosphate synthase [Saccharibacter floricola]|uniref:Thiamine phosphate pyrophosphorylase n=1 Tax=Saccharibacter floricola DSM 15669 TaxID=1123227 RepID=A0ABQ0NWB3_9PROT|nr:thiamine phosphate synthase [Saccharibacter floricola]GBQ04925.1 thiamine phosphate pyrophosphorylase [Saccharibacter floricola DSM 15669]
MTHLPDSFYPIASSADEVAQAVKAGACFIQLRAKTEDKNFVRHEVRKALEVSRVYQACLVVNDHWEIALDEGAPYIHLGQEDLLSADYKAIHRQGVKLGVSTHDHHELSSAQKVDPHYIALGPVWETTLKVMPWQPQGLKRVREWASLIAPIPLVAIGGVTTERSLSCLKAGAEAVAVVSDVFRHTASIEQRVKAWQEALRDSCSC